MSPLLTLISLFPYLKFPNSFWGWLVFFILTIVTLFILWKSRSQNRPMNRSRWLLLVGFMAATPLTTLVGGFRLVQSEVLPPPGLSSMSVEPITMLFSAIPWVFAAGMIGPFSAAGLGFFSGLLLGLWNTHTVLTGIELALLAALFSVCVCQRYRTPFYNLLRHPLSAALITGLVFPINHFLIQLALTEGHSLQRLDYAFQSLSNATLAYLISVLTAGVVAEILLLAAPHLWMDTTPHIPSPSERSLQFRFTQKIAPFAAALLALLVIGNWVMAGNAALDMIEDRMSNAAELSAISLSSFLDIGPDLVAQLAADQTLLSDQPQELEQALINGIETIPFFNQLTIIGIDNGVISSYPTAYYVGAQSPLDELLAVQFAFKGIPHQSSIIPPSDGQKTAQFSFIAPIKDKEGVVQRVLIGRSGLDANPFTQTVLASLQNLISDDDITILVNEDRQILYHTDPTRVLSTYAADLPDIPASYQVTIENGMRMIAHVEPVKDTPLFVILMVPVYQAQWLAFQMAAPLLIMVVLLTLAAFFGLRYGLKSVTDSLKALAQEASRISQGKLNQPLAVDSLDEVGELRRAFEQMRISLKERLVELNRLLQVSQGVASSLDISEAVRPVLEAAVSSGAGSARVVLAPIIANNLDGSTSLPLSFGFGISQNLYRDLDEQVLALTRQLDRLVLSNLHRPKLLNLSPGAPVPESLMAVALRHENQYYGTLWIAYDQPHIFSEEEVRFMVTLGGQAALAAVNARLFLTAEIGRQRMESILASSPDAILVTDQQDQLLLANPAAWQVLGLNPEATNRGKPIKQVIKEPELLNLLNPTNMKKQSMEITMPGGRIFHATAMPVMAEGQRVGRVCTLRDITHFKELDALKSEFVSTVSHDLRSPLTLMRGYATMLEMVGQLNDQQSTYVHKIIMGVENMSRLVNNLLDLGRIESGVGLQIEAVDLKEIIQRVMSSLQLQATQKRIQLNSDLPDETLPTVEADHALLTQALNNLVDNAIKFTRPEGKVLIRLRVQTNEALFEVIDNGVGISPVDQPHLFEKFFRGGQQSSKDLSGTGLGLAIVHSIAEKHGGRVWADSQLGKGSTFYLVIPITQGDRVL